MLIPILIIVAVVIVAFIAFVASRPGDFRVTRSTEIAAPPEAIFPNVNDLHKWTAWSPWEGLDPSMQRTYEGPAAGVGAIYRWHGNNKIGAGSMTVIESRPGELVRLRLEFLKPFKAINIVDFTFKPDGNQTVVTWTMTGKANFVCKMIGLFASMDKMCGSMFEKGLTQLNSAVSASAKTQQPAAV
jgi:uncharacterized protein YndB with AHSA1/START domain